MNQVGRPSDLTDELFKRIKQSILDGNDLRKTASVCEINEGTFYVWHSDNYLKIADKIDGWKRDRKLMLAEKNIEEILTLGLSDKDLVKTVADMSKFVSETLGRDRYSKRTETDLTTQGKALPSPIIAFNNVLPNNSDEQNSSLIEEDTGGERGDISEQDNLDSSLLDSQSAVGQEEDID